MQCIYCQNSPWSWRGEGNDKTTEELVAIFRDLTAKDGCGNVNLVSPTPYLPFIREAACRLAHEGITPPFVWNSSGYERTETLEEYSMLCSTALFDLRYSRDETAIEASSAPDYVRSARKAVAWAYNRPRTSDIPLIVRILVLPGHAEEAIENLAWLATELSNEIPISVMSQYTPAYKALETPPFDRKLTAAEYDSVAEAASDFGFENGWVQDFAAADPKIALMGENMSADHGAVR
jgi:putative pyruvate formate lyase activating enzyme